MRIICKLKIFFAEEKLKNEKFTQNEFAKRVGISSTALSALVKGKSLPSLEVAFKISFELRKTIEDIWVPEYPIRTITKEELLSEPIEELYLSTRPYHYLKRSKINTFGDLLNVDLKKIRGIGEKSIEEIEEKKNIIKEELRNLCKYP